MRIVIVSDTHRHHEALGVLRGDVLIHCGDSGFGYATHDDEVEQLDEWFARQAFERIFCIGGNHDFGLEARAHAGLRVLHHATYLQDEAAEHGGLTFYGAPWVPELADWAFSLPAEGLRERWQRIPAATDVLITHGPPRDLLDRNSRGKSCGCPDLRDRVGEVRPRLHCFGHIHASAGVIERGGTTFVNAALVDSQYELARRPFEIDL